MKNPGEFTLIASIKRIIEAIILIKKNFLEKILLFAFLVSYT